MNRVRVLTGALVVGATALCLVPVAQAADPAPLTPTVEAWYQPNPLCALVPVCSGPGVLPVPMDAPNAYPAGTLHLGYAAGAETARTYLVLPTDSLVTEVTKAVLTVPLDTAATSGSLAPDTLKAQVCLVSGDVTAVRGSAAAVPAVTCDQSAPLTYVAEPSPHLEADLTPMAKGLRTTNGIALLPDASEVAAGDAWHVAFSAKDRTDTGKTAPASLAVTLAGGPATTPSAAPTTAAPVVSAPPLGGGLTPPDAGGGEALTPAGLGGAGVSLPSTAPTTGQLPEVAPPLVQLVPGTAPVALPETVTFGYAYPAVWLLPLVFLVAVPAVARALTKELTPAPA